MADDVLTDVIEKAQTRTEAAQEADGEKRLTSLDELIYLLRARYPLIWVVSYEEQRVLRALKGADHIKKYGKKLYEWSITEGWRESTDKAGSEAAHELRDPQKALNYVMATEQKGIFVLRDFHAYLQDPTLVRRLRDIRQEIVSQGKTLILLSPTLKIPQELEKEIAVVDWDLPPVDELRFILDGVARSVNATLDAQLRNKIAEAALGLTAFEAENVFAKSYVQLRRFDLDVIHKEKEQIIRKSGILEFLRPSNTIDGVGGLEHLKTWLKKREQAFSKEARDFGLPQPKGILLLGVPGCGKSLSAKSVSNLWHLPLLRLDIGRVFGSLVGSSEENIRRAIKTAESVAPCILWLDELEKGLSGVASSGQSDAGTTSRVFGTFITWLQEKRSSVFVIATANQVKMLPPELLRKGRFDEIFFVDLPSSEEREHIWKIHIRNASTPTHPRKPEDFDLRGLAEATEGYSGAEIEESVNSALYDAFDQGMDLNTEGLLQSVEETVPLSQTMQEDITAMREWAKTRARFASIQSTKDKSDARRLEL